MRSLHDVHAGKAYEADPVRPSVRMIQLENRWTDCDEIWYGLAGYPKIVLSNL
jgi:hypothetical protein